MEKFFMGIDPSTKSTGYAILNEKGELVDYGVIKTTKGMEQHLKVAHEYRELKGITERYNIAGLCSEEQFGGLNVDTLKKLCHVSGVVMLLACELNVPFIMKYPASWRKDFHGKGNVKKEDTLKLVNERYGLELKKKDNDIADAVGMAFVAYRIGIET